MKNKQLKGKRKIPETYLRYKKEEERRIYL